MSSGLGWKVNISDIHKYVKETHVEEIHISGSGSGHLASDITSLKFSLDNTVREMKALERNMCTHHDLDTVYSTMEEKLGQLDLDEYLQGKANKQSVANALHRKANKIDVEG